MIVTRRDADQHAFKTPSLREIAARAPFMYHGQFATLEAVIVHYVTGGQQRPSLAPQMKPLSLTAQDIQDLAGFMRSLSSSRSMPASCGTGSCRPSRRASGRPHSSTRPARTTCGGSSPSGPRPCEAKSTG